MSAAPTPARAVRHLAQPTQEAIDRYVHACGLDQRRAGSKPMVSKRHAQWARQVERAARLFDVWPGDDVYETERPFVAEAALADLGLVSVPPVVPTGVRSKQRSRR